MVDRDHLTPPRDAVYIWADKDILDKDRKQIPWIMPVHESEWAAKQHNWNWDYWRSASVLVQHACSDETANDVETLATHIVMNQQTSKVRSRIWAKHFIENIPHLCTAPMVMPPFGSFRGVPAFIVGNGPSLAKNKRHIEEASKRGIVFAVNGATKVVTHHIQVCVESNDIRHKLNPDPAALKAYSMICDPRVMAHGGGTLAPIWAGELSILLEQLTGWERLWTSGSGSVTAMSLAMRLGCHPIVLVGQDLAWTDNKIYSDSGTVRFEGHDAKLNWVAPEHDRADPLPASIDVREVPGWGGGMVKSSPNFEGVRMFLQNMCRHLPSEYRVVNATEGGARIEGWSEERLEDVVAGLKPRGRIGLHGAKPLPKEQVIAWLELLQKQLKEDPKSSMLLDYWIAHETIETLQAWRGYFGTDHKEKARQVGRWYESHIEERAKSLGSELDRLSIRIAGQGRK